jgi:putative hydrolase of the HAD superfamily
MHDENASELVPLPVVSPAALLIDGLGTLVSLRPPAPCLVRELFRRLAARITTVEAERALAAEIAFYRAHMGDGRDDDSLAILRRQCAEVLRRELPDRDGLTDCDLDALTEVLLASLRFEAFADARGVLLAARARGARVIVVSNWDVSLADVLERIGLAPLLHGVVTSAAVGAPKPAPEIFRHALAVAGVPPDRAVHVGDSLSEDVRGAQACGIAAVLLCRDANLIRSAPATVTTISSLAQLAWP